MAKAILSSVLAGLRGRIDGMVFRQQAGQTVVTPRPKVSGRASTPAQLAARERFSRAAAFGRSVSADPALRTIYAEGPGNHRNAYVAALTDALQRRQPAAGLLHHSDRGSQYVDGDYIEALLAAGIERSMSRAGNCYDNAAMESFWSTLKTDTGLDEAIPDSRRHTELAVFDYIETFYNPTRRHSSLGNISPVVFEKQNTLNKSKAA